MIGVQVVKERIRVLEFMKDYDKLRSGRIPVTSFHRALDLCGFGLSQAEVSALEKRYVQYMMYLFNYVTLYIQLLLALKGNCVLVQSASH